MKCRHCQTHLKHTFIDLGFAPPSNAYLTQLDLNRPETYFPLKITLLLHLNCLLEKLFNIFKALPLIYILSLFLFQTTIKIIS